MIFKKSSMKINIKGNVQVFHFTVSVNQSGSFTTNLPEDISKLLLDADIRKQWINNNNKMHYDCPTYTELHDAIETSVKEYESVKVIDKRIVLKYLIQTQCTYCMADEEVVPNGYYECEMMDIDQCNWKQGTEIMNAGVRKPFGFLVYVNPVWRITSERSDGYQIITTERLHDAEMGNDQINLRWLEGLTCIDLPYGNEPMEMDYTEERAKFFVDMIKSICLLNERIKDFLEPEQLQLVIDKGLKLLN